MGSFLIPTIEQLLDFGAHVIVSGSIATVLATALTRQFAEKAMETYKGKINRENAAALASLQSSSAKEAFVLQDQLKRLTDITTANRIALDSEQKSVVADIFEKMVNVERRYKFMAANISIYRKVSDDDRAAAKEAIEIATAFRELFERKLLWLPKEIADEIDTFSEKALFIDHKWYDYLNKAQLEPYNVGEALHRTFSEELRDMIDIRIALVARFREYFGVESRSS